MKNPVALVLLAFLVSNPLFADSPAPSKRLEFENSKLENAVVQQFSEETLLIRPLPDAARYDKNFAIAPFVQEVAGDVTGLAYSVPSNYSAFQIYTALIAKVKADGFSVQYECTPKKCGANNEKSSTQAKIFAERTSAEKIGYFHGDHQDAYLVTASKISPSGKRQWLSFLVNAPGTSRKYYALFVDETQAPKNEVRLESAEAIAESIEKNGKAALYGIFFDTNQAVLKPESQATIEQISLLLQKDPKLRLIVTGHTDSQGEFAYNVKLSEARSRAVVERLTQTYKVAPGRLIPFGAGMAAPAATNANETGRALNRRVELVKI